MTLYLWSDQKDFPIQTDDPCIEALVAMHNWHTQINDNPIAAFILQQSFHHLLFYRNREVN